MIESSTIPRPEPSVLHQWNTILARNGLSVWAGSSSHLIYGEDDLNTLSMASRAARKITSSGDSSHRKGHSLVPIGGAGDSDFGLFLNLALQTLSNEEMTLLQRYQDETASELSAIYGTSTEAIKCRVKRLRKKIERTAHQLSTTLYGPKR